MKKIYPLILVMILAFNITGGYIVFKIQQSRIRREIKHRIKAGVPGEELHRFSFSKDELENIDWVRRHKEFTSDGRMYDIVHTETHKCITTFYCVNDKEEEVLFAQLDELVRRQYDNDSQKPGSSTQKLIKLFSSLVTIFPDNLIHFNNYGNEIRQNNFLAILYSSPFLSCLGPPPKSV